ncbi:MAG TPA: hypothetical protein O0X39_00990, partial [Methanocorpusculum sp.]|nr:hypothetical protein [Methanocorpusculum sp.]
MTPDEKLGTIPISPEFRSKTDTGMWVFETDEGKPPRMYIDGITARLLGLSTDLTPEKTFEEWGNKLRPEDKEAGTAATEKMVSGIHAEFLYSWKHPDGHIAILRSVGVRNFSYTKGLRIEGYIQNITGVSGICRLGTISLSPDLLKNSHIGQWAFELDEGKAPRMYADDVMLGLLGLDHQISPEETYHAWYDNIDTDSYGLVAETVEKMTAGEHAEVQYPWHNPNGKTEIVRCGGVRNPAYTAGVRIEGCHQNVTDVLHYQKLGTISLSPDLLKNANIGQWAFELDEGKAPRMYVDDVMLGLIGLDHQISPEETYHAWYDNIDPDSYGLVAETVEKMVAGSHAEVQYPWHHPDGTTFIVRCGGVRNPAYTAGVRIEGCHQNVTDVLHYQKLGTISLSPDLLKNANIGQWAFELDDGKAPRMYVDDVMLGLIGLDHQISPEETYHAWYD